MVSLRSEINNMGQFTHLHVHTHYSVLDGAANIKKLLARAIDLGMTSIAITDHGNMYGVKEFHDVANKMGIKPILGCEVYVASGSRLDRGGKEDRGGDHLILLAKNLVGYHNLIKLVSSAWTEGFYYNPRIDKEILAQHAEGLVCSSACLGGEIPQLIMQGREDDVEKSIEWFKSLFGDDYYLEMQLHKSGDAKIDGHVYENQVKVNAKIKALAAKYSVKVICTNDVHYIKAEDAAAHDRLICLSTGRDLDDPTRMRYTTQEYLKSEEEMATMFADYPEALENTAEIADKIEQFSLSHKPYMPDFPLPDDFVVEFEAVKKTMLVAPNAPVEEIEKAQNLEQLALIEGYTIACQFQYLSYITYVGAKNRWGEQLEQNVTDRLAFELATIEKMGFPGYFLIVWDFIRASREMGVSVGPGRGSAAGSAVAYCLGITNIDPIKYDLLFERFLNPERISMPDVDIDFDEDGREKALRYVVEKYGKKRVAHIITFGTMAARSSIKDVARIHKLPLQESDRLSKLVPEKPGTTLEQAYKEVPELGAERESENPLIASTLQYAEMLEGTVRNTGVHACGVIISKDDLENFIPVCTAKGAELNVVQYEGSLVEDVGLLKMDFLGLKTLSIIQDAVDNIRLSRKIEVDIDNIPLDDVRTFELYSRGETTGLFQFESPGMKKHLRNLAPNRFEDLIAMNALYRPGPMDYIEDFIDRKHKRKKIEYDLPAMEEYLADTYGITVYQEQVMLLSQKLAGFTKGQADTLRKAMGKKQRAVLDKMKPQFLEGAAKNGHPTEICEKIWTDWEAFASYAFNKSHATCYAYISYQTAYLKAHYPAEFMAALLSRNLNSMDKLAFFMDECKRMGSPVLGPDVNKSRSRFSVDNNGNIRFGMNGIKGVGENAIMALVAEREQNGEFKDIYDFFERVPLQVINKKNVECLAYAGAFDSLWNSGRSLLFVPDEKGVSMLENLVKYGQHIQNERNNAQNTLFGDMAGGTTVVKPTPPAKVEEWGKLETLNKEKEVVGIYLSAHPLDEYKIVLDKYCSNTVSSLADLLPWLGKEISIGGMVTSAKHLTTKTGKPYGRFTIEDFSGSHEFVLFGKDWEMYRFYCQEQNALMVRGRVQEHRFRKGELDFSIVSMKSLNDVLEDIHTITLTLDLNKIDDEFCDSLIEIVKSNPGKVLTNITVVDPYESLCLPMLTKDTKVEVSKIFVEELENMGVPYSFN